MREGIDRRAMTLLAAGHLGTDFANGTLPALLALMLLARASSEPSVSRT
ncbi:MAG TPA: hypothetical protein VK278_10005 [Gaiellaceae bacterium]|nr:hypothetical protein [Gaiellaceae bacterium]